MLWNVEEEGKCLLSLDENKSLNQANSFLTSSNKYISLEGGSEKICFFFSEVKQVVCYTDVLRFQNYKTKMNWVIVW